MRQQEATPFSNKAIIYSIARLLVNLRKSSMTYLYLHFYLYYRYITGIHLKTRLSLFNICYINYFPRADLCQRNKKCRCDNQIYLNIYNIVCGFHNQIY